MNIERDLHDLLHEHDLVIVPRWGGFLTHYRSARLDEVRKLIHPPGKDISFNRKLDRNDGVLADHIARRINSTFTAAQGTVEDAVRQWRKELEKNGRLELPHIGIFYLDDERNLQFDPDHRVNYLKDAYGLEPIPAVAVESQRIREAKPAPKVVPLEKPADGRARLIWAAAAASALLFGAASFWAYSSGAVTDGQWSSFDPFSTSYTRQYSPPVTLPEELTVPPVFPTVAEGTGVTNLRLPGDPAIEVFVHRGGDAEVAAPDATTVAPAPSANIAKAEERPGRYHVIGGCFAQEENADRFLEELQARGHAARKLARSGQLFPVAYGSYQRRKDALEALAAIKQEGVGAAWLLVR